MPQADDRRSFAKARLRQVRLQNLLTGALIVLTATLVVLLAAIVGDRFTGGSNQDGATASTRRPPPSPPPPPPQPPLPKEPVSIAGAAVIGQREAPLAVIGYTDVECPYCAAFARNTWPELRRRYIDNGAVLFVLRLLPLDAIHPQARQAAEAMECAGRQGKLFDLHDRLFERPKQADAVSIATHVKALGLDTQQFAGCMANREGAARVDADVAGAGALGASGTPTFFIGVNLSGAKVKLLQRVAGAVPLARWQPMLDRLLAEVNAAGQ